MLLPHSFTAGPLLLALSLFFSSSASASTELSNDFRSTLKSNHPTQRSCQDPGVPTATKEIKGIWLSNVGKNSPYSSLKKLKAAVQNAKDLNLNTLYPVIWNKGHLFYNRGYTATTFKKLLGHNPYQNHFKAYGNRDILAELLPLAKKAHLRVVAWFEYGLEIPADSHLALTHPEWLSEAMDPKSGHFYKEIKRNHVKLVYLNPFHPEVQTLFSNLFMSLIKEYPQLDGIQIDDHFAIPSNFGVDAYTLKNYWASRGVKTYSTQPQDLLTLIESADFKEFKVQQMNQLIVQLSRAIKKTRGHAELSLSPLAWPYSKIKYSMDWPTWLKKGWVSESIVQLYGQNFEETSQSLEALTSIEAHQCNKVAIGIIPSKDPEQSLELLRFSRLAGYSGFSLFHYGSWIAESFSNSTH